MSPASQRNQPVRRRSTHQGMPMAYAAVGASSAPDLMRFPPEDTTPYEDEVKLGSGQDRFLVASSLLMTWGAQRGAGYTVSDIDPGEGEQYTGLTFDEGGRPESSGHAEHQYGPDGEPYLTAGTTAVIDRGAGETPHAIMVVYTVDEPRRVGFAWGAADETGAIGEQLLTVEYRDDDSVWACARGFMAAAQSGLLGLKGRATLKSELAAAHAQLRALAPHAVVEAGLLPTSSGSAPAESVVMEDGPADASPSDERELP
ncbi:hypothetical protein K8P10_001463 [Leucobacter sp. Psy1]|uniref:DUF1990 family protein n=1 Tax=Leucobacter sp. Psy1 TaxID=2875729 RepID=UPI001CD64D30|nr:DUF1990 family protein [Leucobacter sp. Psy1]UBH05952.1 hypothetical protein K8P10_001463 [Leucobacter sp. Psy1]